MAQMRFVLEVPECLECTVVNEREFSILCSLRDANHR
jgi:hypothetical protein